MTRQAVGEISMPIPARGFCKGTLYVVCGALNSLSIPLVTLEVIFGSFFTVVAASVGVIFIYFVTLVNGVAVAFDCLVKFLLNADSEVVHETELEVRIAKSLLGGGLI